MRRILLCLMVFAALLFKVDGWATTFDDLQEKYQAGGSKSLTFDTDVEAYTHIGKVGPNLNMKIYGESFHLIGSSVIWKQNEVINQRFTKNDNDYLILDSILPDTIVTISSMSDGVYYFFKEHTDFEIVNSTIEWINTSLSSPAFGQDFYVTYFDKWNVSTETYTGFSLSFSTLTITDLVVEDFVNAFYVTNNSYLEISSSIFKNNSNLEGAAGAIYNRGTVVINGSTTFDGNGKNYTVGEGGINNLGLLILNSEDGNIVFVNNKYHYSQQVNPWQIGTVEGERSIYNSAKGEIIITGDKNKVIIADAIAGRGWIRKTGNGELIISGTGINFQGRFVQTAGTTTVTDGISMFTGNNYISNSVLNITGNEYYSSGDPFYRQLVYQVTIGDNGVLNHYKSDYEMYALIYGSSIKLEGSNAKVFFGRSDNALDGDRAKYILVTGIEDGKQNTVEFSSSDMMIAYNSYLGSTTYIFSDSTLDISAGAAYVRKIVFSSADIKRSDLVFGINFTADRQGYKRGRIDIDSDFLISNSDNSDEDGNLTIGLIKIYNDNEKDISTATVRNSTITVLRGLSFKDSVAGLVVTTEYEYKYSLASSTQLYLEITKSSGDSLDKVNKETGLRQFNFSFYKDKPTTYKISGDLVVSAADDFYVLGYDGDASHSVLSGDDKFSFFKLTDQAVATNLLIQDLTIQNAFSSDKGSVLNLTSTQSTATLSRVILLNNKSQDDGGAIYVSGHKIDIEDAVFSGNRSESKGGIIYIDSSSVSFSRMINFSSNSALSDGGAIYAKDSIVYFVESSSHMLKPNDEGTLAYVVEKTSMSFSQNRSEQSGGFLYLNSSSAIFSPVAVFIDNSAKESGGVFYTVANSYIFFEADKKMEFSKNRAVQKGGVFAVRGSSVIFNDEVVFTSNTAFSDGGVFYTVENSYIYFASDKKITISSSTAGNSGGAFFVNKSTMIFNGEVSFANSSANVSGGAIYLDDAYIDFEKNVSFTTNTAASGSGGALFVDKSTITFSGEVSFDYNASSGAGGVIYAIDGSLVEFSTKTTVNFRYNISKSSGGALFVHKSTVTGGSANFETSTASVGGAVYLDEAYLIFDGENNRSVSFNRSLAFGSGGAVYVNNSLLSISSAEVTFETNISSAGVGGAIFAKDSYLFFGASDNKTVRFNNSYALSSGGALYLENSTAVFNGMDVNFEANKSSQGAGGAVFIKDSYMSFSGNNRSVTMNNSLALSSGGAMFVQNSSVIFSSMSVNMSNNVSTGASGGAIYLEDSYLYIGGNDSNNRGVGFTNNYADDFGGALYITKSSVIFSSVSVSFTNNTSSKAAGGAIYMKDGYLYFSQQQEVSFVNNISSMAGGALYVGENSSVVFESSMTRMYFHSNKSVNGVGGAIYIAANSTVSIARGSNGNTELHSNTALSSGGAIYNEGTLNMDITSGNITFNGNQVAITTFGTMKPNDIYNTDTAIINITGRNASTITFYSLDFNAGIMGGGTINQDSNGTVRIRGNESDFNGVFRQSSGTTIVEGNFLEKNGDVRETIITGGTLELTGGARITTYTYIDDVYVESNTYKTIIQVGEEGTLKFSGLANGGYVEDDQIVGYRDPSLGNITSGTVWVSGGDIHFEGSFGNWGGDFIQTGGTARISTQTFGGLHQITGGNLILNSTSTKNGWTEIQIGGKVFDEEGREVRGEGNLIIDFEKDDIFHLNGTASGDNRITGYTDENGTTYGKIEKHGEGTVILDNASGDFSGFSYTQNNGTITVNDATFFGGNNNISGLLEMSLGSKFVETSTLAVHSGGENGLIINSLETKLTLAKLDGGGAIHQNSGKILEVKDSNFSGTNNVAENGSFIVTGAHSNYTANLSTNTTLIHNNTTVGRSNIAVSFKGSDATATFGKDDSLSGKASYSLSRVGSDGGFNQIIVNDSNVLLTAESYIGSTTYILNNVDMDLTNIRGVRDYTFEHLQINNGTIYFGVSFDNNADLTSDKLTNLLGSGGQIGFDGFVFYGEGDNLEEGHTYTTTVLEGLTFNSNVRGQWATTKNEYTFEIKTGEGDIEFSDIKKTGENTLKLINDNNQNEDDSKGTYDPNANRNARGFSFSTTGTYTIGDSFGPTAVGKIIVYGVGGQLSTHSVISGADSYSLFKINGDYTNLEIRDLTIQDAAGVDGSAIYMNNSKSTITLTNVTFRGNESFSNGGAIYNQNGVFDRMERLMFSGNTAGQSGGAIYTQNGYMDIRETSFIDNTAENGDGGAVFIGGKGDVKFWGTTKFSSNDAQGSGGAVYVQGGGTVTFNDTVLFETNTARGNGGALFVQGSSVLFKGGGNIVFSSNMAEGSGGAFYAEEGSYIHIMDNKGMIFSGNEAGGDGGAINIVGRSTAIFTGDLTFTSNSALGNGGAFKVDNSYIFVAQERTVIFSGNESKLGGGGGLAVTNKSSFVFTGNVEITSNTSWEAGGAFYAENSYMYFSGNRDINFRGNQSLQGTGGAFAVVDGSNIIFESIVRFTSNTSSSDGGALSVKDKSLVQFAREDREIDFSGNASQQGNGGGFAVVGGSSVIFNGGVRFTSNTAYEDGGAIYAADNSFLKFGKGRSTFLVNRSTGSGGAISLNSSSAIFNGEVEFSSNTSYEGSGGAMFVDNSFVSFTTDSTRILFSGNNAHESGGAVFVKDSKMIFENRGELLFEENVSSGMGGGVYADNSYLFFSTYTTTVRFRDNQAASSSGTALALIGSTAIFDNASLRFEDTLSSGSYSLVYLNASSMAFTGNDITFHGSTHSTVGYAIYAENGSDVTITGAISFEYFQSTGDGQHHIIYEDDSSHVKFTSITKITATGNKAEGDGGFMKFESGDVMVIDYDVNMTSNTARKGGALYIVDGTTLVFTGERTEFYYNNASTGSGAIYIDETSFVDFSSTTLIAKGNIGVDGGFMELANREMIFYKDVTISENISRQDGGGLKISTTNLIFEGNSVTFELNRSTGSGAAIYAQNSVFDSETIAITYISSNVALSSGGAIFSDASKFIFNSEDANFISNVAMNGGGVIYATNNSDFEFNYWRAWIGDNFSKTQGGAVYSASSTFLFNNEITVFVGNKSDGDGGAMYITDGSSLTFISSDTYFQNNRSEGSGGALYITNGSTVTLWNTNFYSNYSKNSGGAVVVNNGGLLEYIVTDNKETVINGNGATYVDLFDTTYYGILNGIHIGDNGTVNFYLQGVNSIAHVVDTMSSSKNNSQLNVYGEGNFNLYLAADMSSMTINESVKFNLMSGATLQVKDLKISSSAVLNMDSGSRIFSENNTIVFEDNTRLNITNGSMIIAGVKITSNAVLSMGNERPDTVFISSVSNTSGTFYIDTFASSAYDQIIAPDRFEISDDTKLNINTDVKNREYRRKYYFIVQSNNFDGRFDDKNIVFYMDGVEIGTASFTNGYRMNYNDAFSNVLVLVLDGDVENQTTFSKESGLSYNQKEVATIIDKLSARFGDIINDDNDGSGFGIDVPNGKGENGNSDFDYIGDLDYVINRLWEMNASQRKTAFSELGPYFLANILLSQNIENSRNDIYNRIQPQNDYGGYFDTWMRYQGGVMTFKEDDNSIGGYRYSNSGTIFGMDTYDEFYEMSYGLLGRYNTAVMSQNNSDANTETYSFGGYSGLFRGDVTVKSMLGVNIGKYETRRVINSFGRRADAKFNSFGGFFDIEASYILNRKRENYIQPFVGFYTSLLNVPGFEETTADSLNLEYSPNNFVRSAFRGGVNFSGYKVEGRLRWSTAVSIDYITSGKFTELTAQFVDTDEKFKFRGVDSGNILFSLNLNTDFIATDNIGIYFGLNYTGSAVYNNFSGSFGIRYMFD